MSDVYDPNFNQRKPTGGRYPIQDMAKTNVSHMIDEQRKVGIAKYGQELRAFDGRDSVLEIRQEFADVAVYLEKLIAEYNDMWYCLQKIIEAADTQPDITQPYWWRQALGDISEAISYAKLHLPVKPAELA